ncbi:hypothetical protein GOP47_0008515 [Adiantum capillus-veneris]|uniref:C3H1-type domain-containing protein n=1 Tax=Adiantum capillus-veneris TaxID=13818 RepID=A0A9D4ZKS9_ADICA|nr:hypothetical protein GOP47_0008515 [Adiantum capillus-veneris]
MAPSPTQEYKLAAGNPTAKKLNESCCSSTASEAQLIPATDHIHADPSVSSSEERSAFQQCKNTSTSTSRCMKFFSTSGCPYGEHCHFQHFDVSQLARTINMASLQTLQGTKKRTLMLSLLDPSLHVKGYKTKLCHNYQSTITSRGCKYGEHCHFAHSKAEQRSKIPNLSDTTHAPMDTLSYSLYDGEVSPPGVPSPCDVANSHVEDTSNQVMATRMPIDAGMAGFIIGRAGVNVRQISKLTGSKLSIREHSQKVRMVHIEGLPHHVDGAQEILRLLLEARKGISLKRS